MPREITASVGQRLLWHLDRYRGGDGALNCPVLCRITGTLDRESLQTALDALVARHEALRTTFDRRGRRVVQIVHEPRHEPLRVVEIRDTADPRGKLRRLIADELSTPIDASAWPVRATLWRSAEQAVLCLNQHHLVSDGRSGWVAAADLATLYSRALGRAVTLPPVGWQYSHFTNWQSRMLARDGFRPDFEYWTRTLAGASLEDLPLRPTLPHEGRRRAARVGVEISAEPTAALRRLARSLGTSLFTVLLSVYYRLLSERWRSLDVTVASVFANRSRREVARTVGFLANLVLLRVRLQRGSTLADLVAHTHRTVAEAFVHQALPFHLLPPGLVSGPRRPDGVVFQMIGESMGSIPFGDATAEIMVPEDIGSRFELELLVIPREGALRVLMIYDAERVDDAWASDFVQEFAAIAGAPTVPRGLW